MSDGKRASRRDEARFPLRALFVIFLWLAGVGLAGVSLAALAGPLHWSFLLLTHFRPWMAAAALPLALLALGLRQRWWVLALLLCLLANAWPLAVAWNARAPLDAGSDGQRIRVLAFNLYYGNDRLDEVRDRILASDADLVLLSEVLKRHAPLIEALAAAYPYHALPGSEGSQGEALFSRLPLGETVRRRATESASLWIVEAEAGGRPLELFLGHPLPAANDALDRIHRAWFDAAAAALDELPRGRALLVVGDLNATPWSPRLAGLMAKGDLSWTGDGLGTWPSRFPRWASLAIDQVLVSPGFAVIASRIETWPGSDHRALIVDLRLPMQE